MDASGASLEQRLSATGSQASAGSAPVPGFVKEIVVEPVWKSMADSIRDIFRPAKLPPLELTSTPVPVADPFAVERDAVSSGVSFGVHVVIIALIAWFLYMAHLHVVPIKKPEVATAVDVKPYLPIAPRARTMGGGGGGGSHDILQTPKGRLPQFKKDPIVPPMVIVNEKPKLAVDPAINMPKEIAMNSNMPNLGDPRTSIVGPQSNGTGSGAGMGTGKNGGIGSGSGNGYGPGSGGLTGGGPMHVGGGVAAPVLVYSVDPEFSDEARRAKYQGVSVLSIVVDAQGNVQSARVLRPLGMGLDEKAIEAVKQYRFRPATFQGKSVPVEVNIEINFRIY
jgi:TonB family protein